MSACPTCQTVPHDPVKSPPKPWKYPSHPWSRVHADVAMFRSMSYLVVVDSFSKWFEGVPIKSTTACRTVEELIKKALCSTWTSRRTGLRQRAPVHCIRIRSIKAIKWCEAYKCASYHPASNGHGETGTDTEDCVT